MRLTEGDGTMMGMGVLRSALLACLALLVLPGAALAQAVEQYGNEGEGVQAELGQSQVAAEGGALPFTGIDLLMLTLAAFMLVAVGLTIRRVSRARG
jgi:hypothetical protein